MEIQKSNFDEFGAFDWLEMVGSSSFEAMLTYLNVSPVELSGVLRELLGSGDIVMKTANMGHRTYGLPYEPPEKIMKSAETRSTADRTSSEKELKLTPGVLDQLISLIDDKYHGKIFTANTLYNAQTSEVGMSKDKVGQVISHLVIAGRIKYRGDRAYMGKKFSTYSLVEYT